MFSWIACMCFCPISEAEILAKGYPCYTTSCGWLGYEDEKIERVRKRFLIIIAFSTAKTKICNEEQV